MSNKRFDNTPKFIVGDDPVIIQKDTVSTANVFETKDFSGTTQVSISADGVINAGSLSLTGNLTVDGTTTTINSTTLTVDDKNIVLGDVSSPTDTTANGGGITLKGATDKTIAWNSSSGGWEFAPTGIFTTVTSQGRALAIRGDSSESNGILQFTNNAVSAQWASIYATSAGKLVASSSGGGFGIWDNIAAAERFAINASGHVTTASQPRFLVYTGGYNHGGNWQDISTLGGTAVVSYNVGSHWNSSTGLFTAPVSGYYFFYAGGWANYNGAGNRYAISFHINVALGSDWLFISGANTSSVDSPLAMSPVIRYMNAGDYMRTTMFSAVGMQLGTSSHKFYYGGYLLG